MPSLTVYSDNAIEAAWFKNLHPIFENAKTETILGRGKNCSVVENLIQYDRPDIILMSRDKALLVVEKTREVPTGHNVGQRVARLVRAIENNVPTIKYFPFDAKKHGKYAGLCNLNIRLLLAFDRMWKIHRTPIIALNWKSDADGELIDDGSEDDEIRVVIKNYVESSFDRDCPTFDQIKVNNDAEYTRRLGKKKAYGDPPPSVQLIPTKIYLNQIRGRLTSKDIISLETHDESLIYSIKMTESKCKRQDPYTGMQFIYDYIYCRRGINPKEKHTNLILQFPDIRKAVWLKNNPDNAHTKSCNWYLVANALVFANGALVLR
jgi:hypothetical protein